ncbi:MAG TPA: hypothetical protein VJH96_00465 [Patescibacteria group bacterium]|nr:hypothetical protein [Patescibacteria group bacterium]
MKEKKNAFTIIEVLIFVTLISFIFITSAYLAQLSLINTSIAKHKVYATQYAEELLEWLRVEKEKGWQNIPDTTVMYCFNKVDLSQCVTTGVNFASCATSQNNCNNAYTLSPTSNMQFLRYVEFSYDATTDRKTVSIFVKWEERGRVFSVPVNSVFTQYE